MPDYNKGVLNLECIKVTMLDAKNAGKYLREVHGRVICVDLGNGWVLADRLNGYAFEYNEREWGMRFTHMRSGEHCVEEIILGTKQGLLYIGLTDEELKQIKLYDINKQFAAIVCGIINNM